jgi:hypothetical protein
MSNETQPPCLPPRFLISDLRNNRQTITKAKAAKPPTAIATVLSVCFCPVPTPTKHVTGIKALIQIVKHDSTRVNIELEDPSIPITHKDQLVFNFQNNKQKCIFLLF